MSHDAQPAAAVLATLAATLTASAGHHAAIMLAAIAGAMWPLAARAATTRAESAFFLLRVASTAAVLGGLCSWLLETRLGIPSQYAPAAAAWAIGAIGDGWQQIIRALLKRITRAAGKT